MLHTARTDISKLPCHITQRGSYRYNVFQDDEDRLKYLSWIDEYSKKYHLSIFAYCLMGNHVHFIATPQKEDTLAGVLGIAHIRYSQYINKKREVSGSLWQGRFYSCTLNNSHLMAAIRYVEKNPVRAGIVKNAWEWKWSSAATHIGEVNQMIHLEDITNLIDVSTESWKQYLDSNENKEDINDIRKHTLLGFPLGTASSSVKPDKTVERLISVLSKDKQEQRTVKQSSASTKSKMKKRTVKRSSASTKNKPKKRTVKQSSISTKSKPTKRTVKRPSVSTRRKPKKRTAKQSNASTKSKMKKLTVKQSSASTRSKPKKRTVKRPSTSTKSKPKKRTVKRSSASTRSGRKKRERGKL
ncbi:MAG: transposase [Planctomycetota bacterium]|jgi:putative transposase